MDDVFPKKDAEFSVWYANFYKGSIALASAMPMVLDGATVTQVGVNATAVVGAVNAMSANSAYASAIAEFKARLFNDDSSLPIGSAPTAPLSFVPPPGAIAGVKSWTRGLIRRIKADPAYNASIGETLGIVAVRRERRDPILQIRRTMDSNVELRVRRGGYTAVAIESRRAGGAWELIGYATVQQFFDPRPSFMPGQAERREYRAQGIYRNVRAGGMSAVVGVWTSPLV